jgi:L,D-transpeptidase ErfK/SrfK
MDWNTPLGTTRIVSKAKDAPWIPPKSVREEHEKRGDPLPAIVPGGADNPMGRYKMALGIPGGAYLIHGTNKPAGIGMQVTHGCMRLYPEDIETLYGMVPIGTQVTIVNQPYKWGWVDGELLIEVHPPLQEDSASRRPSRTSRGSSWRRPARSRSRSTGSAPSGPGARPVASRRRCPSPARARRRSKPRTDGPQISENPAVFPPRGFPIGV